MQYFYIFVGVYVTSLKVGCTPFEDRVNGILFLPVEKQIEMVCKTIREDENLQNGFNAIGFSQGGLFLRAIAEVCPQGMKKLITFGSPHQGVYGMRCLIQVMHKRKNSDLHTILI